MRAPGVSRGSISSCCSDCWGCWLVADSGLGVELSALGGGGEVSVEALLGQWLFAGPTQRHWSESGWRRSWLGSRSRAAVHVSIWSAIRTSRPKLTKLTSRFCSKGRRGRNNGGMAVCAVNLDIDLYQGHTGRKF